MSLWLFIYHTWIFSGAPLKFNGAAGNIPSNLKHLTYLVRVCYIFLKVFLHVQRIFIIIRIDLFLQIAFRGASLALVKSYDCTSCYRCSPDIYKHIYLRIHLKNSASILCMCPANQPMKDDATKKRRVPLAGRTHNMIPEFMIQPLHSNQNQTTCILYWLID